MLVDRILNDLCYWKDELSPALDSFFYNHVIPELLEGTIFEKEFPECQAS